MPLDYLNTLYKLAIDRERVERKKREEEEQRRQQEEALKRQRLATDMRGRFIKIQDGQNKESTVPSMSRMEAEALEDMLEEGM